MSETVEWGNDQPSRLDRFTAGVSLSGAMIPAALVILGVVLLAAAEVLPWTRLDNLPSSTGPLDLPESLAGNEFRLADFNTWEVFGYHFGWIVLLALVGAALTAGPGSRRQLGAASLGAAGGLLALLVGLFGSILDGRVLVPSSLFSGNVELDLRFAPGAFCAIAALLVVCAALVTSLGLRLPRRQPATTPEPEYAPAPEVTVAAS